MKHFMHAMLTLGLFGGSMGAAYMAYVECLGKMNTISFLQNRETVWGSLHTVRRSPNRSGFTASVPRGLCCEQSSVTRQSQLVRNTAHSKQGSWVHESYHAVLHFSTGLFYWLSGGQQPLTWCIIGYERKPPAILCSSSQLLLVPGYDSMVQNQNTLVD